MKNNVIDVHEKWIVLLKKISHLLTDNEDKVTNITSMLGHPITTKSCSSKFSSIILENLEKHSKIFTRIGLYKMNSVSLLAK